MKSRLIMSIALMFLMILLSPLSMAQKRVALIVGNSAYPEIFFNQIPTAINDANIIKETLERLGFTTYIIRNGSRNEILDSLKKFQSSLSNADVAVFYYSGHGCSIEGTQYLVPCEEKYNNDMLNEECISLQTISNMLEKNIKLSLLFIDACRDIVVETANGGTKAIKTFGVPAIERSKDGDQVIYFATRYGKTAPIGHDLYSPFTKILAEYLYDEREFRSVWKDIKREVPSSDNRGSYSGNFYFNENGKYTGGCELPETKSVRFDISPNYGKITINNITYDSGSSVKLTVGQTYSYKVEANGYQSKTGSITVNGGTSAHTIYLDKIKSESTISTKPKRCYFFDDDGERYNIISYHYSPLNPIGFSYLRTVASTPFLVGGIMACSQQLFVITQTPNVNIDVNCNVNIASNHHTETIDFSKRNIYSDEVDPYREAVRYNSNFLFLGNAGYKPCNGITVELGAGMLYHGNKYYMGNTYSCKTEYDTDVYGSVIQESVKKTYYKNDSSKWYKDSGKVYFAMRLGLDLDFVIGYYKSGGISVGGGYTYIPSMHSQSSWDLKVGGFWTF